LGFAPPLTLRRDPIDTERMSKVLGALVAAVALVALTGCATPMPPTPASPSPGQGPEQAAPSESPASDSCASLTGDDVRAAIMALPGWSYDVWSASTTPAGMPQPTQYGRTEYVAPDRLRVVGWDPVGIRHGQIIIGDRMWSYSRLPALSPADSSRGRRPHTGAAADLAESSPSSAGNFATMLEIAFPFKGTFSAFPFPGDLPGDGLRESPRVADTECLAADPNTGLSLVTTRSGQLVRMTSGTFSAGKTLIFNAMPPTIEPPTVADLKSKLFAAIPAMPLATDPR
jgi:hypothetical protein